MNLTDLTPDDAGPTIEALHVKSVYSAPDRFFGRLGNNTWWAVRAPGFTATIVAGDVIQISQNEFGYYEASAKLGTRADPATEYTTFGLPWDYTQFGWNAPAPSSFYSNVQIIPPAVLDARDKGLVYGYSAGADRTFTAYYGPAGLWAYPVYGAGPAQKISLLLTEPNPIPLEMTLLSARYPADVHTPVDVVITPTLEYYGPVVPNVIDLPANWKAAFADGSAGAIRFGPVGTTPGLTRVELGTHRSLSLHS